MCSADQIQAHLFGLIANAPPEDKCMLDNYPGERGYSPRAKLGILALASLGSWAIIAAATIGAYHA